MDASALISPLEISQNDITDPIGGAVDASTADFQSGLGSALDRFKDSSLAIDSNTITLGPVREPESVSSLLKDRIGEYVEQERGIDGRLNSLEQPESTGSAEMDGLLSQTRSMLDLQIAYQQKSLNGAMLLATAKSAEGFVKTLMRSQ